MFSTSVGRVVRTTCAACSQPTSLTARSLAAASKPLAQRSHQRRQSSSKASIPPDGSSRSTPSTQQTSSSSGRVGRRKGKDASSTTAPAEKQNQTFAKQYPNLPRVESTSHLLPKDVNISSFFSLHRPISITHSVPPPATHTSFSSVFEPRETQNKPQDVIITLSSFVENLEQQQSPSDDPWQTNDQGSKQLDGPVPPNISLDNLVARFQPFKPPPAPLPFPEDGTTPASQQKASTKPADRKTSTRGRKAKPKTSTWKTTIIVTEYTNPSDGSKVCHVATAPLTRIPNAASAAVIEAPRTDRETEPARQPFLRRMWLRRMAWEDFRHSRLDDRVQIREPRLADAMQAISVKRQRKLKMKKHKYKKLMRRTRNLRRKLGKL